MQEFRTTILGRWWRVVPVDGYRDRYGVDGDCDLQTTKKKAIRYDPDQKIWDLVETICHEAHHAAFPSTSEEDVTQFNHDLRRILERLFDVVVKKDSRALDAEDRQQ